MAKLKRNMIELVKEVKDEEVITVKYWTPPFLTTKVVYEAMDLSAEIDNPKSQESDREKLEKLAAFVADEVYGGQFSKEELENGLHGPKAIEELRSQLFFAAFGDQSDATKKFLEKKN